MADRNYVLSVTLKLTTGEQQTWAMKADFDSDWNKLKQDAKWVLEDWAKNVEASR